MVVEVRARSWQLRLSPRVAWVGGYGPRVIPRPNPWGGGGVFGLTLSVSQPGVNPKRHCPTALGDGSAAHVSSQRMHREKSHARQSFTQDPARTLKSQPSQAPPLYVWYATSPCPIAQVVLVWCPTMRAGSSPMPAPPALAVAMLTSSSLPATNMRRATICGALARPARRAQGQEQEEPAVFFGSAPRVCRRMEAEPTVASRFRSGRSLRYAQKSSTAFDANSASPSAGSQVDSKALPRLEVIWQQ